LLLFYITAPHPACCICKSHNLGVLPGISPIADNVHTGKSFLGMSAFGKPKQTWGEMQVYLTSTCHAG